MPTRRTGSALAPNTPVPGGLRLFRRGSGANTATSTPPRIGPTRLPMLRPTATVPLARQVLGADQVQHRRRGDRPDRRFERGRDERHHERWPGVCAKASATGSLPRPRGRRARPVRRSNRSPSATERREQPLRPERRQQRHETHRDSPVSWNMMKARAAKAAPLPVSEISRGCGREPAAARSRAEARGEAPGRRCSGSGS